MPSSPLICDATKLVNLVRAGDMMALDAMTRCFGERLVDVGRRRCRNEQEAEDAVQDALLAAGTHLESFRGEGSLEGWLVRMVINACNRMRRGRKNDPHLHDPEAVLPSMDHNPEDGAHRSQVAEALGQAMLTLNAQDRAILLLAEGQGWTGPEIAQELGLTPGAVRTRLTRIRTRLRDDLVALQPRAGA